MRGVVRWGGRGDTRVVVPTFNMQQYEWTEDGFFFLFFSFYFSLCCYVILHLAAVLLLTSVRWIFFSSPFFSHFLSPFPPASPPPPIRPPPHTVPTPLPREHNTHTDEGSDSKGSSLVKAGN